jgi:NlpC/P60 family putative phage cell wall peptidase
MATDKSPPPCGEVGERSSPGGGRSSDIVSLARSWIGTPYVHQASLKGAGCDCLGLLRGVWREFSGEEPESPPPYSPDWELTGSESLRDGLARHLDAVPLETIAPGDILLFRMAPRAPAKHCAILAEQGGALTLIHARQNKRVSEEAFTTFWRRKLAYAFRL